MNERVVAVILQDIGLVIVISSLIIFLSANGHGGTFWLYPLFLGALLTISAFFYLGSKAGHSP
ncbi:MAG: hypothetical protein ABSB26_06720 [Nitrososphaerales archaeon]|jgi:hypothetical protein